MFKYIYSIIIFCLNIIYNIKKIGKTKNIALYAFNIDDKMKCFKKIFISTFVGTII